VSSTEFLGSLTHHGFDFFVGVPCSLLEALIAALERGGGGTPYVAAVREDAAVGVAAGAWLGGRRPTVLIQNSGLGTSLNALASLSLLYGLPALVLVTWRGYLGKDAPEHLLMGEVSPALLDLLGVPYRVPSTASLTADIAWAAREMDAQGRPVALLLPPGILGSHGISDSGESAPPLPREPLSLSVNRPTPLPPPQLSRLEALAIAVKQLGTEPVIHANGYICRESFSIADRPSNFYMIGSMGLAAAIGLGLALVRRERTVVFDGDGNLLMNLGILAMVGGLRPPNLVHCVFDNEVYGSTGNQRSLSAEVRLDAIAGSAGYRTARAVTEADEFAAAMREALGTEGPHFILVKVTAAEADVPRIPHSPAIIRDRFRASLGS